MRYYSLYALHHHQMMASEMSMLTHNDFPTHHRSVISRDKTAVMKLRNADKPRARLEDDAIDEPLPMPPHWHAPRGPGMFRFLFVLLCIIAVGQPDLEELWEGCRHDSNAFRAQMARLTDPLTTVIVVVGASSTLLFRRRHRRVDWPSQAGLVLSSISAFVTTVTPLPGLFNYTTRGIYILFVLAFGLSLGGVVVGSAVIYVTSKVRHTWFLKVRSAVVAAKRSSDSELSLNAADVHVESLPRVLLASPPQLPLPVHRTLDDAHGIR